MCTEQEVPEGCILLPDFLGARKFCNLALGQKKVPGISYLLEFSEGYRLWLTLHLKAHPFLALSLPVLLPSFLLFSPFHITPTIGVCLENMTHYHLLIIKSENNIKFKLF
jgi:hypothetical protein